MTTNESFFFRDVKPFDQFKALVLPHLIKTRATAKSIRIWSAACSKPASRCLASTMVWATKRRLVSP